MSTSSAASSLLTHIQHANDGQVLKLTQEMARYEMVCHVLERGHST